MASRVLHAFKHCLTQEARLHDSRTVDAVVTEPERSARTPALDNAMPGTILEGKVWVATDYGAVLGTVTPRDRLLRGDPAGTSYGYRHRTDTFDVYTGAEVIGPVIHTSIVYTS